MAVMELKIVLEHADTTSDQQEQLNNITKEASATGSTTNTQADMLKKAAGVALAVQQVQKVANQVATYALTAPGTIYNDQARQNEIDNLMNASSMATGLGKSVLAGALVAGPVGAVVAGIGSLVGTGFDMYNNNATYQRLQTVNNINSVRSSESLGMISSDNNR